jgi:CheY-like chemotaxis protein
MGLTMRQREERALARSMLRKALDRVGSSGALEQTPERRQMTMTKSWAASNMGYVDDTAFDNGRGVVEGDELADVPLGALPDIRPARLLLAEEDDELRRSIAGQLRNRGYEVDEAFSGYEAIALIARQSRSYDLIITDLQLFGMNGLELIDELRAGSRSEDNLVPVIVLGEEPSGAEAREAERLHAVMMEKPCDLERLWHQAESLARPVQIDSRAN